MNEKKKGVALDIIIYFIAFGVAIIPCVYINNIYLSTLVFTLIATLIVFVFSCIFSDVSIYDPYWSVAPPIMILINMVKYNLWNANSIIVFIIFLVWAIRLTGNWLYTYKGLKHEDWRYAMYRKKYSPILFHIISFVGLHYVPTIVVYASLISGLVVIQNPIFNPLSLIGAIVMLFGIVLEFISDTKIHKFLKMHKGEHKTCNISVWKYSRHPNYLGEMSFWTGLYVYSLFANILLCSNVQPY